MSLRAERTELWLLGAIGFLAILTGLLAGVEPRLAIAGAMGIAFAYVALTDLPLGLALFTFLGFVVIVPNFAGETLSVIKLAALPLLFSWLAVVSREGATRKTFMEVHPAITLVMFLFVGWVLCSAAWAEDPSRVMGSLFRYLLAMVLIFVVYTAVQREEDLTKIIGAMVLGAVCAAGYGFLNPAATGAATADRLSGTLGDANQLAAALVLGIGLSGGLAAIAKTPLGRGAAISAGGICLIGTLMTGSRGGLVALVAMLIAAVLLARGRRIALTLVTLTVLLAAVGYFVMAAPYQARERVLNPGREGGTGRTDIWTVGSRMASAHPITGVGAGNFQVSSIHYLLQPGSLPNDEYIADSPAVAHNMYLEVLAELGVVGLILFLAIIIFSLGCSLAALSRFRALGRHRMETMTTAIAVSLIGLLAADFFLSEEYAKTLWLLIGLGPALLAMTTRIDAAA